jgi:asparagine synthase (glutamine-hydrolysing)
MCGICGKLMFDRDASVSSATIGAMADAIRHRGPDDDGFYVRGQIGLGFRRLSIIDLNTGHQPVCNETGSVWVIFNGEIYNYQELRAELLSRGHVFKTQTDTEVLVHLYEDYGTGMLEKLRGMFGFAIWDNKEKTLLLARDRVGIKPLYYSLNKDFLSFGSEIKTILADDEFKREVDPTMVDRFLTFYYMPGQETLLKNVFKLPPGSYLLARNGTVTVKQYWDLSFEKLSPPPDEATAKKQFLELLDETVRLHMISDVPVGFLLSGGVDSTAMLSFAENANRNLSSYTVGFSHPGVVDERPYARLAAKTFGTQHHEISISHQEFVDFIPDYVWHMEEPVCEPPAINLYYVSKLARRDVKVLISGEGGDEAFAGYSNYRNILWLERIKKMLGPAKGLVGKGLSAANALARSGKLAKYASMMGMPLEDYYYSRTATPFNFFNRSQLYSDGFASLANKRRSIAPAQGYMRGASKMDVVDAMLYVDTKTWLPDDLLVKADKMTMANSIELRVPFLDHKVLEFAASLRSNLKVRGWTTKYLAKKALGERVPKEILNRKKVGFPVPYECWQRTHLKTWLSDVLFDQKAASRGYFDPRALKALVSNDSTNGGYSKELFSLAVLEMWHRIFVDAKPTPVAKTPAPAPSPVVNSGPVLASLPTV